MYYIKERKKDKTAKRKKIKIKVKNKEAINNPFSFFFFSLCFFMLIYFVLFLLQFLRKANNLVILDSIWKQILLWFFTLSSSIELFFVKLKDE
jgi:hypothetical protein